MTLNVYIYKLSRPNCPCCDEENRDLCEGCNRCSECCICSGTDALEMYPTVDFETKPKSCLYGNSDSVGSNFIRFNI